MRKLILLSVLALATSISTADTITTLFADNNSGGLGGGVYFDVTVGALPIEITGYEVNSPTAPGAAIAFEVYTHAGGHAGNESSPAGWNLEATGSGTTAGSDLHSIVPLNSRFVLAANTTVGMAITLGSAAAHRYTNGNGANQHYEDANVAMDLGTATNIFFSGSAFSPRVWNGTIHYNVIPEPATLTLLAIGGLALIRRR